MSESAAARAAVRPRETTHPIGIRIAIALQREMTTRRRPRETAVANVRVEAIDESADDLAPGRAIAMTETVAVAIAIVIVRAIGIAEDRVNTATVAIDREGRDFQPLCSQGREISSSSKKGIYLSTERCSLSSS